MEMMDGIAEKLSTSPGYAAFVKGVMHLVCFRSSSGNRLPNACFSTAHFFTETFKCYEWRASLRVRTLPCRNMR